MGDFKLIGEIATDDYLTFNDDGKVIGRLFKKEGKLNFEGDVEKSAKIFFDAVIKMMEK